MKMSSKNGRCASRIYSGQNSFQNIVEDYYSERFCAANQYISDGYAILVEHGIKLQKVGLV